MKRWLGVVAVALAFGLIAVSCGDDDGDSSSSDDGGNTTTAGDDSTSTSAAGSEAVVISTAETDYGQVLTDGDGYTLYIFTDDGTGEPTCVDGCAEVWPPVVAENIETRGQLDIVANLVDGDDAERQVTINGRPIYTYEGDLEAGMAAGQGFGGKWFVLDADGNPVESTDAAVTTTTLAE